MKIVLIFCFIYYIIIYLYASCVVDIPNQLYAVSKKFGNGVI